MADQNERSIARPIGAVWRTGRYRRAARRARQSGPVIPRTENLDDWRSLDPKRVYDHRLERVFAE